MARRVLSMKKFWILCICTILFYGPTYAQVVPEEGVVKTYYESGALKAMATYKDSQLNGSAKKYFKDGTVSQEAYFANGAPVGIGKIYYPSGEIEFENFYRKGKLIGFKRYDIKGNLIDSTIPEDQMEEIEEEFSESIKKESSGFLQSINFPETYWWLSIPIEWFGVLELNTAIMVGLVIYLIMWGPVHIIAYKEGIMHSWLAYVPLIQFIFVCRVAKQPIWLLLFCIIPYVGILFYIIVHIILWSGISKVRGKPAWIGLLTILIPVVGFFSFPWFLAFVSHSETIIKAKPNKDPREY